MPDDSMRTVLVALGSGLAVALAKVCVSFAVAYVVLAISTVFDLVSFRQSAGQMIGRARRHHQDLMAEARGTSDPTLRAVFVEDAVSVSGDVITLAALALNQLTGSSIPQGIAAVLIGLVLIRTSLRLGKRSHDFLVGAWLVTPETSRGRDGDDSTQPLRAADEERVRALAQACAIGSPCSSDTNLWPGWP
jgi:hypothetical protein